MMRTKLGVFFDLYGTLLVYGDMRSAWSDWIDAFFSELRVLGLSMTRDAFAAECDGFLTKEQPPGKRNGMTPFEARILSMCEKLGVAAGRRDISEIADRIVGIWERHVALDEQALFVLGELKKSKVLALISNFEHPPHFGRLLARHGLAPFFRSVVVSGAVGFRKPDPRIFGPALKETGLDPRDVVYVGDTEDDVAGARAAGILPVLIERPRNPTDRTALDFSKDDEEEEASAPSSSDGVVKIAGLNELPGLLLGDAGSL